MVPALSVVIVFTLFLILKVVRTLSMTAAKYSAVCDPFNLVTQRQTDLNRKFSDNQCAVIPSNVNDSFSNDISL